jgi:NAD-reducing hydrogenase large subunit
METAANSENLRRIVIDPVTRVEGHGKVTLLVDEHHQVQQARLHIVEFRGFEKFIQGRPYWELPLVVQRLCGICPVSHHLAAAKAIDQIAGVDTLSPTAEKLRRLMHLGQVLQSHALHFFHLASPDLLFGFTSDVEKRNIIAVLDTYPDIALKGIRLRKFGQEVIRAISGKRIHGIAAVPGGMNKALTDTDVAELLTYYPELVEWAQFAVELTRDLYLKNRVQNDAFGRIHCASMGLIGPQGELELYHGGLRLKNADGTLLHDHYDYTHYTQLIHEEVKNWSYMKFPFLIERGPEQGWYRVGPLARINNCDRISTPLAERCRQEFLAHHQGQMAESALAYHWARMIEVLHCAEAIHDLLHDDDLKKQDLQRHGTRRGSGIGVIEAPRGTLIHHFEVNEQDLVTRANLIVSTTHNNQAMNESIRVVARDHLNGNVITPELLNMIEVAIRAYDPCLSCATHAMGKMPLQIELRDTQDTLLSQLQRDSHGQFS